jgi:predicted HicB family RNase H-like nuclease
MAALADMALEVTDELGDRVVEVRLDGTDVRVVVSAPLESDETASPPPQLEAASGELSRITLRLPEELKMQAEHAAAAQAISLNTWLLRATQQAVQTGGLPPGRGRPERVHRVRGWVQA